jgi:hypothetical protein
LLISISISKGLYSTAYLPGLRKDLYYWILFLLYKSLVCITLPLDLYNHYWSTTHTCVEQFSHHHACVPGPPVFTSLAELCTLHLCFRDLMHNIYIYTCHVIVVVLYLLPANSSLLSLSLQSQYIIYSRHLIWFCIHVYLHHLSSIFHCSYLF